MTREEYLNNIEKLLKNSYFTNKDAMTDLYCGNRLDFLRCKSGYNRAGKVSVLNDREFFGFYLSVKAHQAIAEHDIYIENSYKNILVSGVDMDDHQPRIFCSFHLGSYTIIPQILLDKFKVALVINEKTLQSKGKIYDRLIQSRSVNDYAIINAEDKNAVLAIIKKVRQGFSLMFYIDGNTGVGGFERKDDKLVSINFLSNQILSRKGIAFLSYKLNIPIIPIYAYRESNNNHIQTEVPITKESFRGESIESFVKKCTQQIWRGFEKILLKYPDQWEGWMYLHSFYNMRNLNGMNMNPHADNALKNSSLTISSNIDLFSQNSKHYTYDYRDSSIHEVNKGVFTVLHGLKRYDLSVKFVDLSSLVSEPTLQKLISNSILTPSL